MENVGLQNVSGKSVRKMKAYTVYQPYAYATAVGLKQYEARTRRTNIRGRVAVHAGSASLKRATKNLSTDEFWRLLWAVNGETVLPLGAVVGTVEIVDCVSPEFWANSYSDQPRAKRSLVISCKISFMSSSLPLRYSVNYTSLKNLIFSPLDRIIFNDIKLI